MQTADVWRRRFLAWCLQTAAFLPAIRTCAAEQPAPQKLVALRSARRVVRYQRHYRVQAAVLILGIPIFRQEDVGAGCATVEVGNQQGGTVTAIQFAAGSRPQRAHGLNRFGALSETAVETSQGLLGTEAAGFITCSPEKTLDQAQAALHAANAAIPCAFSSSSSGFGQTEVRKGRFTASGIVSWTDAPRILSSAQQESASTMQLETRPVGPVATFLYAIRSAALNRASRTRARFCHNGDFSELVTERTRSRLAGPRESLEQIDGVILDAAASKQSEFTIWIDPSDPSGLPTRIEFYARSFLRLTLEARPASEAETLPWLLKEEPA